jgi:hypothetical protein
MSRNDNPAGEHAKTQRLLPWLLTGTLEGAELALVQQHLRNCAACRADLAWQRRLRATGQGEPELDPDAALARLAPRLDAQPDRPDTLRRWAHALAANDGRWLRPLAAAQFAVIAALAALLLARPGADQADYRTLGAGGAVQGDLVVSFRPDTPEHELRRILQASGTRVLDGPTVTGAYVLTARGAAPARALARLRAEPAVTLAQPLGPEGRP